MLPQRLRFGAFIPPVHPIGENPTLCIERDLELIEQMERFGYDEAWIGEHHSGGFELIASPELFVAAAAQRTRRIRLGTGVCSLPYQHPLILADRMNQLDHMTRGRAMFGMGPGALVADAFMQGYAPGVLRDRFDQSLDVIVRLMRGETVTASTDWFECRDARLQMTPYSRPSIEMVVANNVSPTGAKASGRHGIGMLSLSATTHAGFNALGASWSIASEAAAEHGQSIDRAAWRLVGPMHVAETREKALEEMRYGAADWVHYYTEIANIPIVEKGLDPIEAIIKSGIAIIGSPDEVAARISAMIEQSGGFGAFLTMDHNWASWPNKMKSYEMFARHVMPRFQNLNPNRDASAEWVRAHRDEFTGQARAAVGARILQHIDEKGADNVNPEILRLMANHNAQN